MPMRSLREHQTISSLGASFSTQYPVLHAWEICGNETKSFPARLLACRALESCVKLEQSTRSPTCFPQTMHWKVM